MLPEGATRASGTASEASFEGEASRLEGGHMRGHPSKRSVPQWNVPPIDAGGGVEPINSTLSPASNRAKRGSEQGGSTG